MQLSNYVLVFKGQFINTRFDYFFSLTCDFKKPMEITQVQIDFFTFINNEGQRVPQLNLTNIFFPFTDDNCELKTEGGLVSKIVEKYIEAFKLSDTLQQINFNLNNVFARNISDSINRRIQSFFQPMTLSINTKGNQTINAELNYTMVNDIVVEPGTNVTAANFAIIPTLNITNSSSS